MIYIEGKMTEAELAKLRAQLGGKPGPVAPVVPVAVVQSAFETWPAWAKWMADRRTPGDVGPGDTLHRMLGQLGEVFKMTLKAIGVPCGCDRRQDEFNAKYPYSLLANAPEKVKE